MVTNPDNVLLRQFVEQRSETAFANLVQRHVALVYATARRRLAGDGHLADDVAQTVFLALARKAPDLVSHPSLAGWLHVSTLHASAEAVRREQRRRQREATAPLMPSDSSPSPADAELSQLRPVLDDALLELAPADREAVIQRFFARRSYAEIGEVLQLSEEAARKRVDRSLEKLHGILARRGVATAAAALGGVLTTAGSEFAPPAHLALQVSGAALSQLSAGGTALGAVASHAAPALAAVALVLGAAALWPQLGANDDLRTELARLHGENRSLRRLDSAPRALVAQPPAVTDRTAPSPRAAPPPLPSPPSLPSASATKSVILSDEGTIQWEGRMITLDDFLANLARHEREHGADSAVFVRASARAHLGQLYYVVDEAAKAGVQHLVVESGAQPERQFQGVWF